jgi:hypothetical protein
MLGAKKMHSLYPTLFVRPGGLPGASDIKTYDAGNFNIATQGLAANTATLGELRVRYSVTLSVPVLESQTTAPANNSVAVLASVGGGEAITGAGIPQVMLLANTANIIKSLGIVNTAGSMVFPAGNYIYTAYGGAKTDNGSGTNIIIDVQKNGTSTSLSPLLGGADWGGSAYSTATIAGYFTSNGSDAITVVLTSVGTTVTAYAQITVLAV